MTGRGRRLLAVAVPVAVVGAMMISAHVRWRAQVVLLYLTGQIADIGLKPACPRAGTSSARQRYPTS